MILLIDNYDSFTYNLVQMLQAQTDLPVTVYRNDALTLEQVLALKPAGIVLSPGPGHPAIAEDFGVCAAILEHYKAASPEQSKQLSPLLGVCLGHQGMGLAFGAEVTQAPEIIHGKASPVHIDAESALFNDCPNPFEAMRYHSLIVANNAAFPHDDFEITATTHAAHDETAIIMAMQHRTKPMFGVQFHPESIGTPEGNQMLGNFIALVQQARKSTAV
ncbi:MAG: aminodeoxychorismate/anthranilate synthase component II [Vampirovibrionales bacterium]|nr:aminodeoxychorismate/anthranilate synthase component II [Vampirovibrionales bacterium]